jgi:aryl-alcohol dehydrogenase-like predicted oxidoreductase
MDYTTLGRTGLRVSVAGLGCGGFSRLGLGTGKSPEEAERIVQGALERGVTLFDTAAAYSTEPVVGRAIKTVARDQVVICTKALLPSGDAASAVQAVIASLENSLRALDTDYVDVFQLHGVPPAEYERARDVIAPALLREKAKGKLRHLGITETAPNDPEHRMLSRAAADGLWDVAMVAFHMLHQNARQAVFPLTRQHKVGTLLMFAVRKIFAQPALLAATLRELAQEGDVPAELAAAAEAGRPLDFLIHPGGAASLTDAAYRYARHEPGVDVVLFGTGDLGHLETNLASLLAPPLPEPDRAQIASLFGTLVGIGLDRPDRITKLRAQQAAG